MLTGFAFFSLPAWLTGSNAQPTEVGTFRWNNLELTLCLLYGLTV